MEKNKDTEEKIKTLNWIIRIRKDTTKTFVGQGVLYALLAARLIIPAIPSLNVGGLFFGICISTLSILSFLGAIQRKREQNAVLEYSDQLMNENSIESEKS